MYRVSKNIFLFKNGPTHLQTHLKCKSWGVWKNQYICVKMSTEIFKIEEEMIKKMEHKVAEGKTCSMPYVGRSKNKNDLERIIA